MTTEQAVLFLNNLNNTAMSDIVKRQYFVLLFRDTDGEIHGYDTKYPAQCLAAVMAKNPTFEFVHAIAETAESAVRNLCMVIRTARNIRIRIKEQEQRPPAGATRA